MAAIRYAAAERGCKARRLPRALPDKPPARPRPNGQFDIFLRRGANYNDIAFSVLSALPRATTGAGASTGYPP